MSLAGEYGLLPATQTRGGMSVWGEGQGLGVRWWRKGRKEGRTEGRKRGLKGRDDGETGNQEMTGTKQKGREVKGREGKERGGKDREHISFLSMKDVEGVDG